MSESSSGHSRPIPALLACIALLAAGVAGAQGEDDQPGRGDGPALLLSERAVTASGMTAGGEVALFGVSRRPLRFHWRQEIVQEVLLDEDGDGAVVLALDDALPGLSLWVAVDLATGESVVAFAGDRLPVRGEDPLLSTGSGPAPAVRVVQAPVVDLLLVRPGVGAWGGRLGDGAFGDRDAVRDGTITVALEELEQRVETTSTAEPPPARLIGGDLVLTVDPRTLSYGEGRVR